MRLTIVRMGFRAFDQLGGTLALSGASSGHALPLARWVGRGRPASAEYAVTGWTRSKQSVPFSPSKLLAWILFAQLLLHLSLGTHAHAESSRGPLLIFAAASLADAMTEVGRAFEEVESTEIIFNFASSSMLARQIKSGAPADVFMSADEAKMDDLEREGWLISESRNSLLGNQLVIVVPLDSKLEMSDERDLVSASITRIALADPRSVPAGIYARSFLQDRQLWDILVPKVIPTVNVRASLAAVESGNVDAGFVYLTDAASSEGVSIRYRVPIDEGPVISYPVAVIRKDTLNSLAARFVSFLSEAEPMQIFISHGFVVPVSRAITGESFGAVVP